MNYSWQVLHRQLVRDLEKGLSLDDYYKTSLIRNYTFAPNGPDSRNWKTTRTDANWRIGLYEGLALVAGVQHPAIANTLGKLGDFQDGGGFHGAYGPRARAGLELARSALQGHPDSRRVWVPIYVTEDLVNGHNIAVRDTPCTLGFHFTSTDNGLGMTAVMRSWDVWWGLPYDVPMFAMLQASMAQALGWSPHRFEVFAMNVHLYDRNLREATEWLKQPTPPATHSGDSLYVSYKRTWAQQRTTAEAALAHLYLPEINPIPEDAAEWLKEALAEWHT